MSIPCWRFSHLNTWRLYWIILRTRHVTSHQTSKYSESTSKYRVNPMLEVKHNLNTWRLDCIIICSWYVIGHQTSKYMSIPCWMFSHLNTCRDVKNMFFLRWNISWNISVFLCFFFKYFKMHVLSSVVHIFKSECQIQCNFN